MVRSHLLRANPSALQIQEVDLACSAEDYTRTLSLDEPKEDGRTVDASEVSAALGGEEIPQNRSGVHIRAAPDAEPIVAATVDAVVAEFLAAWCTGVAEKFDGCDIHSFLIGECRFF